MQPTDIANLATLFTRAVAEHSLAHGKSIAAASEDIASVLQDYAKLHGPVTYHLRNRI